MQKLKLIKKYLVYPKYKNIDVELVDSIPVNWNIKKLKFISYIQKGKNPQDLFPDQVDGMLPYLSMEYLRSVNDNLYFADPRGVEVAEIGDTILLWDGSNAGEFIRAKNGIVSSTSAIVKFTTINKNFGYYFSKHLEKYLKDQTVGMGIPHVNGNILENLQYNFPDDINQDLISKYLDSKTTLIDKIIEKKQKQIELLKEKRTAVIEQAVTRGLNHNITFIKSGIEWVNKIPEEWTVNKLKHLGQAIIGLTYAPEEISDESGTLVLRSSNVQNGNISMKDNVYVSKKIPKKLVTKIGDILICSRNGSKSLIGKNAIIGKESEGITFGAFMTIFRSPESRFISYFLKSNLFQSQLNTTITSTINQLTTQYLNNISIIVPPVGVREEVCNFLDKKLLNYEKSINSVSKSIQYLQEFKSSLISNVVTGKVKV